MQFSEELALRYPEGARTLDIEAAEPLVFDETRSTPNPPACSRVAREEAGPKILSGSVRP
jgi:hypothetical protein